LQLGGCASPQNDTIFAFEKLFLKYLLFESHKNFSFLTAIRQRPVEKIDLPCTDRQGFLLPVQKSLR